MNKPLSLLNNEYIDNELSIIKSDLLSNKYNEKISNKIKLDKLFKKTTIPKHKPL